MILGGGGESEAALSLNNSPAALNLANPPTFVNPVNNQLALAIPAAGINWGEEHDGGAVDIAGVCGSNIYAAAAGLATEVKEGWNHGYGNYLIITHDNGTTSLYAHNQKNLAAVGQYVAAGDVVAKIGQTGNASGCHVHFKIEGQINPFVHQ